MNDHTSKLEELQEKIAELQESDRIKSDLIEGLLSKEKRFKEAIEILSTMVCEFDLNMNLYYANETCLEKLGYTEDDIDKGLNIEELVHPEDFKKAAARIKKMTEGEKLGLSEYRMIRKNGGIMHVLINSNSIKTDNNIKGFRSTLIDISKLKETEDALRISERRFKDVAENSMACIWEIDTEYRYTYTSPIIRLHLGYSPAEMQGKSFFDTFHPENKENLIADIKKLFERKQRFRQFVNRNIASDGREVWVSTSAIPIIDKNNRVLGYRGVNSNITDRKHADEEIDMTLRKLKHTLEGTINAMVKILETKDPYTAGHQNRVAELANLIAEKMNLTETEKDALHISSITHDIGKIYIPTEILSKPSKLSSVEIELIRTHAQKSYDILKNIDFPGNVSEIVLQHHERYDGTGYPYALAGKNIMREAQILAVADVVEAMSSHRPYRPALGIEEAIKEIKKNRGILYDPEVVDTCLLVIPDFIESIC